MRPTIEFYFDFGSPYSYLAQSQLEGIARAADASIIYMPTSVMDLMKATGNRPTSLECANKKNYVRADLQRWVQLYQVPWQKNPHFRTIDLKFLLRAAIAANKLNVGPQFVSNVFRGLFAESLNLGDRAVLEEFLVTLKLPAAQILDLIDAEETKQDLEERTKLAESKGLFGMPSFVVGSETFFGNDRLDFVRAAATKMRA